MGCRCSDIPRCSSDIGSVESILSLFENSNGVNGEVSTELNGLATECFLAFSCKNIQELATEEKKLNKKLSDLIPNLIKKSKSKIRSLEEELSSMESEDSAYHEEQESHHHHDD